MLKDRSKPYKLLLSVLMEKKGCQAWGKLRASLERQLEGLEGSLRKQAWGVKRKKLGKSLGNAFRQPADSDNAKPASQQPPLAPSLPPAVCLSVWPAFPCFRPVLLAFLASDSLKAPLVRRFTL